MPDRDHSQYDGCVGDRAPVRFLSREGAAPHRAELSDYASVNLIEA
jgi:hypothetical protein